MRKAVFICMLFFLGGCSLLEPSDSDEQPSTMTLSMTASSQVNPNVYSENTLAIQIDELQEESIEEVEKDPDETPENKAVSDDLAVVDEVDAGNRIQIIGSSALTEGRSITRLVCEQEPEKTESDQSIVAPQGKGPVEVAQQASIAVDEVSAEATPIAFKIIQMKDDSLFLQADFDGLFSDMEKSLGTTYLTHDDFMLVPGEFKFVEPIEMEGDARYIAVIAAYNDYTNKQWKGAVKIKSKGKEYALFLYFDENQVLIKKQEL